MSRQHTDQYNECNAPVAEIRTRRCLIDFQDADGEKSSIHPHPYVFATLSCTPGFFWFTSSETFTKETLGSTLGAGEATPRAMIVKHALDFYEGLLEREK